ncbi:MAG: Gfo/Idh/MocA family protein [Planctomycetota bacterium]|jgi:predicted dehydrogenase
MSAKRDTTYGVGILGCAHVHTGWYANELRESSWAEVKAVADPDLDRAKAMLGPEAEHIADFYTDPADMLARGDIDVVCISSETSQHLDFATAAAAAGKHICMEKVIALTLADADVIIDATANAGVKLICPPFVHDSKPELLKVKELIDAGAVGKPTLAHFHTGHEGLIYSPFEAWFYDPAKAGGGALMDLGVHPIYDSLFLFGPAKEVSGMITAAYTERMLGDFPLKGIQVEDNSVTTIKFANDMMVVSDVSFTRIADRSNSAIYGTEGTIILGDAAGPLLVHSPKLPGEGDDPWHAPELAEGKPAVEVIADLLDSEEGTPRVTGKWARDVLEIVLASYESAKTGKTISLPL